MTIERDTHAIPDTGNTVATLGDDIVDWARGTVRAMDEMRGARDISRFSCPLCGMSISTCRADCEVSDDK